MSGDDIEWLDEPASPVADEPRAPRRRRRPVFVVVGVVAIGAAVTALVLAGRDERAPSPAPTVQTLLADSPTPGFGRTTIRIPEPSKALLRAVDDYFPGAMMTSADAPIGDVAAGFGFARGGLAIHVEVFTATPDSPIDTRDDHQIVVTGPKARVVLDSPGRIVTGADYTAAKRLVSDRRVSR